MTTLTRRKSSALAFTTKHHASRPILSVQSAPFESHLVLRDPVHRFFSIPRQPSLYMPHTRSTKFINRTSRVPRTHLGHRGYRPDSRRARGSLTLARALARGEGASSLLVLPDSRYVSILDATSGSFAEGMILYGTSRGIWILGRLGSPRRMFKVLERSHEADIPSAFSFP